MQTLRLTLTGAVILVLLVATSLAVMAQDEATDVSVAPVVVTGTFDCTEGTGEGDEPIGQSVMTVHAWQATDPRLSGEAAYTGHWHIYDPPSEDAGDPAAIDVSDEAVYEIVNDGGGWICEASRTALPRTGDTTHTLVFSGEGEYEGMTAYLHVDWSATPFTFSGLIMQGEAPEWAPPAE
jgi:hypothetical protein